VSAENVEFVRGLFTATDAREKARGRASGVPVSSRIYLVITVRERKIARCRECYDEAAARAAAGL